MSGNPCGKTRDVAEPYEVWKGPGGFEWRVLKKYQKPELEAKNPYARWYCAVKSNMTYGEFENYQKALGCVVLTNLRKCLPFSCVFLPIYRQVAEKQS